MKENDDGRFVNQAYPSPIRPSSTLALNPGRQAERKLLENKQLPISVGSPIRLSVSVKNVEKYPIEATWHLRIYKTDFQGSNGVLIPDECLDSYVFCSGVLNSHLCTYEPFASNAPQNFEVVFIQPGSFRLCLEYDGVTNRCVSILDRVVIAYVSHTSTFHACWIC